MGKRLLRWTIVAVFSVALGHLAWHTLAGPPLAPVYFVGGPAEALCGTNPGAKNLYLRHQFFLSQKPRHAWFQVIGRDHIELFVNGKQIQDATLSGYPVAILADLTPFLRQGANVLAVVARQQMPGLPPVAVLSGAYMLAGVEHSLGADQDWQCSDVTERQGAWWFQLAFKDLSWPRPGRVAVDLCAKVRVPPGATTTPTLGAWISPPGMEQGRASLRRQVEIPSRPRSAWLRVTTGSAYRLAVNGVVVDQQEDQVGTSAAVVSTQRTYDITTLLRAGRNTLAVMVTSTTGPPHLLADLGVEDADGQWQYVGSDEQWLACAGAAPDWLAGETTGTWAPCVREAGDLGVAPWLLQRQYVALLLPPLEFFSRLAGQLGLMLGVAIITGLACLVVSRRLSATGAGEGGARAGSIAYLALLPAAAGIAVGVLATYDPRVGLEGVYRGVWVLAAVASVLVQWSLLALLARRGSPHPPTAPEKLTRPEQRALRDLLIGLALAALMATGFWIRFCDIETEPLHWDEVTGHEHSRTVLERGFPSTDDRDSTPIAYTNTSELTWVFTSVALFFFEDDRYAMRVPSILWTILTIPLIHLVGRRMFRSPAVGLTAAVIYTFAPVGIAMSLFGRYFAQLQFFSLSSVWLFWETLQAEGSARRRYCWLTTASFGAVFLSWEGGALIASGMILAALLVYFVRSWNLLADIHALPCVVVAGLLLVLQFSHRTLQQTQSLWYGVSASDATLKIMWPYSVFQPLYYIWEASWNLDAGIPMLLLLMSLLLAVGSPWRRPLRFLLTAFLTTCLVTSAILSLIAWRYSYHLIPLLILPASATIVFAGHRVAALVHHAAGRGWHLYGRGIAFALTGGVLVVGSGLTVQTPELDFCHIQGYGLTQLKYVNLEAPCLYLRDRIARDDILLANAPDVVDHFLGDVRTNFWVHSTLHLPATLDDRNTQVIDRRNGTRMLSNLPEVQDIFARGGRIWYVVTPNGGNAGNTSDVSAFLRQHMDIVYEDYQSMVLVRDNRFRTAEMRQGNERALRTAGINPLP